MPTCSTSTRPTHTWKDFFIHIATICVGLLITIGLEQTVEAVHHHRQREELKTAISRDTRQSIHDADAAEMAQQENDRWLKERIGQVRAALDTGKSTANAPPTPAVYLNIPYDYAWKSAKASGRSELLSQEDIRTYNEVGEITNQLALLVTKGMKSGL